MLVTDKPAFVAELVRAFRFAGKDITTDLEQLADWVDEFMEYPIASLLAALKQHRRNSPYPPKPADIYAFLESQTAGHPAPDEAWGMLMAFVSDEGATGFLTDQMREAWRVCGSLLDMGDNIGARMCFLETYRKALKIAAAQRTPPAWHVTLGADVKRRKPALQDAVARGYISADYAASLLPAPVANLERVAGLLEGKVTDNPNYATYAERLRDLVKSIKAMPDTESPAAKAQRERREYVEAQKAKLPPKPPKPELEPEPEPEPEISTDEELPTKPQRRGVA